MNPQRTKPKQAELSHKALEMKRLTQPTPPIGSGRWWTKAAIAADLGCHPNSVTRMVREKRFPPPVKVSDTFVRWPDDIYQAWKREQIEARDRELEAS
jgi:predicted DNA-binding transcriptional regulator AlpA